MVSSVARVTPAVRMELEPGGVLQMVEKVQRWDMGKPQEPEMNRVFGCFWMLFFCNLSRCLCALCWLLTCFFDNLYIVDVLMILIFLFEQCSKHLLVDD